MTLEELIEQGITIQGRVNVKLFNDNSEEIMNFFTEDFEYEHHRIPRALWNKNEVGFMYYAADALQIEVIKED